MRGRRGRGGWDRVRVACPLLTVTRLHGAIAAQVHLGGRIRSLALAGAVPADVSPSVVAKKTDRGQTNCRPERPRTNAGWPVGPGGLAWYPMDRSRGQVARCWRDGYVPVSRRSGGVVVGVSRQRQSRLA